MLETALKKIGELLNGEGLEKPPMWLLGGSCGLLLHGVPLQAVPRDIDLYADVEDGSSLHKALIAYALDEPAEDYSKGCYSLHSHYKIAGVPVELVCGFEICRGRTHYKVDIRTLLPYAPLQEYTGIGPLRLMPLAHELAFNVLRARADRCQAIAERMLSKISLYSPSIQKIVEENHWDPSHTEQLERWLGHPLLRIQERETTP